MQLRHALRRQWNIWTSTYEMPESTGEANKITIENLCPTLSRFYLYDRVRNVIDLLNADRALNNCPPIKEMSMYHDYWHNENGQAIILRFDQPIELNEILPPLKDTIAKVYRHVFDRLKETSNDHDTVLIDAGIAIKAEMADDVYLRTKADRVIRAPRTLALVA